MRITSKSIGQANARGFTLIELLVTITIMAIVTTATICAVQPALRTSQLREATRIVQAQLVAARSEAMSTGRPVGVMFQVAPSGGIVAMSLATVAVGPPYCGDTTSSAMLVAVNGFASFVTGDSGWYGRLHLGDRVKINYRGPLYTIAAADTDPGGAISADAPGFILTSSSGLFNATPATGLPFQIFSQPIPSAAPPVQLPESAVVDLSSSGILGCEFADANNSPTIMFAPNGTVQAVYFSGNYQQTTSRIYLLIGKSEKAVFGYSDPGANWSDPANFWVSINALNGQICTTENSAVDPSVTDPSQGIAAARSLAQTGQTMGGR